MADDLMESLMDSLLRTVSDAALVRTHARAEAHGWPKEAIEDELRRRGLAESVASKEKEQ